MKMDVSLSDHHPICVESWTPDMRREPLHWHSAFEIGYCRTGRGTFYFGRKTYPVAPGDVFVVNDVERHIAESARNDPSQFWFVYFDRRSLEPNARELSALFAYQPSQFVNRIEAHLPVARKTGRIMELLVREAAAINEDPTASLMMHALLQELCVDLVRFYSPRPTAVERPLGGLDHIQVALRYLKARFREDIHLEDVADHLSLSASRTRHLFRQLTGERFKEYLVELRVDEAKRLLQTTERTVLEVCFDSGFQSYASFFRAFREITDLTPQAYRNQFHDSRRLNP